MLTFRFLDFNVYQEAKKFYKSFIRITRDLSREFWSLEDQGRRSALSICLNIAEGSAKSSDRDFNRYIENSLGSVNESVAVLDIMLDHNLISQEKYNEMKARAESIAKQLGGFSKKLKDKS